MKHLLIFAAITIFACTNTVNANAVLTGKVTHVRDGDTIEVGEIPVRLNGLTCDEKSTPLGDTATKHLKAKILNANVICDLNGDRTYDRLVGRCRTDNTGDIGYYLIANRLCGRCAAYDPKNIYRDVELRVGGFDGLLPNYCVR